MTTGIPPLTAHAVSRAFGDTLAVASANLDLAPGEITALVGPSGSGKTTFLRLLAGMERVDAGEIRAGDTVLASPTKHVAIEKREIGLVFQDFALFPHMTALENVMFGLRTLPKPARLALAETWLERLGLPHRSAAYPHQMSGGEQQRTAIARALAPSPVAILLDEPFSGLDPSMRDKAREVALGAVRSAGIPALLVTHDASEAMVHADTVAVIDQGRILQSGSPEQIYRSPNTLAVAKALGPVHAVDAASLPQAWRDQLGGDVSEYWYRPEAIQLGAGQTLTVNGTKLAGPITEVSLALSETVDLYAACQPGKPLKAGETVQAMINPTLFFDFASETS